MKDKWLEMFSNEEKRLKSKIDALCNEWKTVVGEPCDPRPLWFIPDGFYPNYLSQKVRILYIGRDAYDLYGSDDLCAEKTYIEKFIRQYVSGIMDNGKNVNRFKFHKMLIKVAYGLINGCSWSDVPCASEICDNGKIFEKTSFAFMNLCKWSHESDGDGPGCAADWDTINRFIGLSVTKRRNFILEEIELLSPDVIITMNFGPRLIQQFSGVAEPCDKHEDCFVYSLTMAKSEVLILDPWHFSATKKSECKNIYAPLLQMLKKHLTDK